MAASGIIFSNVHDEKLPELTDRRTIASVPYGCRYRFIDFVLSNMTNSNINNISVITTNNYLSLMDHIGSGKDWDLARSNGGIKLLPPNVTPQAYGTRSPSVSRLESLKGVNYYIAGIQDEYVILADSDVICNIDLSEVLDAHIERDARMTIVAHRLSPEKAVSSSGHMFHEGESGFVSELAVDPYESDEPCYESLGMVVMRTSTLRRMIAESISHNYTSFTRDFVARTLREHGESGRIALYHFDGYYAMIDSIEAYYRHSMDLITDERVRRALFAVKKRPILTKVRNSPPTYYSPSSSVRNTLIADGCVIEGEVENSIIFRGVHVGRGCRIRNSIIMNNTVCGENVSLTSVISDKYATIRSDITLAGAETRPFYIPKNKII